MITDAYGLSVSTDFPETVTIMNRLLDRQANQRLDSVERAALLDAADTDPAAMPNIIVAILNIHAADSAKVAHYLGRARAAPAPNDREIRFIAATAAWAEGDVDTAIANFEDITLQWPRDMYAVRMCCTLKFYARKDADGSLALVRRVIDQVEDRGQAYALLSFMEEEAGLFAEAEASARAAVAVDRNLILGQHTVAHVMEAQGRDAEGVAWLEQFTDTWGDLNESFNPHMWMHLGLHHLGIGQADQALRLFDEEIATRYLDKGPAQLYGANLLARVALAGLDIGDRFNTIAAQIDVATHRHTDPLSDLHHVYALASTGGPVTAFIASMTRHADGLHANMKPTWREVVLPVADGIVRFAAGDMAGTVAAIENAQPRFIELGGSAVERGVFENLWLHALIGDGRKDDALAALGDLRTRKGADHWSVQRYKGLLAA
jgi:tetratricopeptide (TPR) repeat protein